MTKLLLADVDGTLVTHEKILTTRAAMAVEKLRAGKVDLIPNPDAEKTYFSFPTRADVRAFRAAGKRLY